MKPLKNFFILGFMFAFFLSLTSCAAVRITTDAGLAMFMEKPSMELVLDRLNAAGSASAMADMALNHLAISDSAKWPRNMETFSQKDIQSVLTALALDGAYLAHGGIISPTKAHIVHVQNILYELPPDMYSSSGDYYTRGEPTLINGCYYKVNSKDDIIVKRTPSFQEIKDGSSAAVKSIFIKNSNGEIEKRMGKIKSFQVTGNQKYASIMEAIYNIAPKGNDLRDACGKYEEVKLKYMELGDEISELKQDKKSLAKNEKPKGEYHAIAQIDEQLAIKKTELADLKEELDESNSIQQKEFDLISDYKGEIHDPEKVRTLINIGHACGAIKGLLADSIGLTAIALAKLPRSLVELPSELKQLTQLKKQGIKNAWLPLRLARLRFNIGNVADNIRVLDTVLKTDLSLVIKIHKKVNELSNPAVAHLMREEMATETGVDKLASLEKQTNISKVKTVPLPDDDNKNTLCRKIQSGLTILGYSPGKIDGKPGKKTRVALQAFEKSHGYTAKGKLTKTVLVIIKKAVMVKTTKEDKLNNNSHFVKSYFTEVQSCLTKLGFDVGGCDGIPGKKTQVAVQSFQKSNGYPVDGAFTNELLTQIKKKL